VEVQVRVRPALAQGEGGPAHHLAAVVGRVPLEVVQRPAQVEVGGDAQETLA